MPHVLDTSLQLSQILVAEGAQGRLRSRVGSPDFAGRIIWAVRCFLRRQQMRKE